VAGGARIPVARVRSTHAARRELRLEMLQGFAWPETPPKRLRFEGPGAPKRPLKVENARDCAGGAIIAFPPGVPRDVLGPMEGARLMVEEAAAGAFCAGGWYAAAWLGFAVVDDAGHPLGRITEVWEGPANAAFTVEDEAHGTMTLPAIDAVVLDVDPDEQVVRVGDVEPFAVRDAD